MVELRGAGRELEAPRHTGRLLVAHWDEREQSRVQLGGHWAALLLQVSLRCPHLGRGEEVLSVGRVQPAAGLSPKRRESPQKWGPASK